ncbi:unnamed protein product [Paramecium primaurelia]|nr:unnamed protein product [Paramecium primaurelia]
MIAQDADQRYTATQCLNHTFFLNEMATQLKLKIQESPTKDSFDHYLDTYNSPDQKLMNKDRKNLSIVTRTPIYAPKASTPELPKQRSIMEELSPISSFSLDQQRNESNKEDQFQFIITK